MGWDEVQQQQETDSAISDVLDDPEILSGMREAGVSAKELKQEIGKRKEELDRECSAEFSRLQGHEQRFAEARRRYAEEVRRGRARKILMSLLAYSVGTFALSIIFYFLGASGTGLAAITFFASVVLSISTWRYFRARFRRERREKIPIAEHAMLTSDVEAARKEWRSALRVRVAGMLREQINRRKPSYSLILDISEPKGLAELDDPQYLITVPTVDKVNRLISAMPGGSIGISGPRGVGKTTLLRQFCSKEHAPPAESAEGKPPLRILISAPVKYDAREFVLLLFSRLCGTVAPGNAISMNLSGVRRNEQDGFPRYRPLDFAVPISLAFAAGWGTFLLISSASGWKLQPQLAPAIALLYASFAGSLCWAAYRAQHRRRPDGFMEIKEVYGEEAAEATTLLRGLAYQQSVSRAWSAGIKIPVGLEAGVSTNTTMAEKPMGFPELVARLNDFLRKLALTRKIFIGIDELDKIDSDEQVYRFINDIKGIFGREDCFYLISISDNAMSSFERRGLPVRDAFDSSLDTVVSLDPAELSMSRTLMRRRVIGMPEAFLCLCHVISGGLPRDLIRSARELNSLSRGKPEPDRTLEALTRAMVQADLQRKVHAVEVAAQRIDFEPEVGTFICTLHEGLQDSPAPTSASLLGEATRIATGISSPVDDPDFSRSAHEDLNRLRLETAAYLYFCSTLIGTFTGSLDRSAMEHLSDGAGDGCLSRLAQVRSDLSVNPRLAWRTISAFRNAHGLEATPYPEPTRARLRVRAVAHAGSHKQ
ncbi:hypothetical protein IPZ58_20445 [Streptomyces roseoverticillatus]|uniref:hypothetical protein n=1 Tax=Streptomyces roseoverticillatus TaxID=66429 RepID=UPI001F1772F8|nr:hypothetical protein [Streptomyces roseoverticillatus]MCF3103941.1 hypothetical protein [Streptomyces roseoverticillatus]